MVINADLMAAGLQVGWRCLSSAATPATCGEAIEVPDRKPNSTACAGLPAAIASRWAWVRSGVSAARMSVPGAVISGFRMLALATFGPREDEPLITGATTVGSTMAFRLPSAAVAPVLPAM